MDIILDQDDFVNLFRNMDRILAQHFIDRIKENFGFDSFTFVYKEKGSFIFGLNGIPDTVLESDLITFVQEFNGEDFFLNHSIKEAKTRIDETAGSTRLKYITSIPGQNAVYTEKLNEALRLQQLEFQDDPTNYPFLNEESTMLQVDISQLALQIIAIANGWKTIGAKIEGTRIKYKTLVENVQTVDELNDIISQAENAFSVL